MHILLWQCRHGRYPGPLYIYPRSHSLTRILVQRRSRPIYYCPSNCPWRHISSHHPTFDKILNIPTSGVSIPISINEGTGFLGHVQVTCAFYSVYKYRLLLVCNFKPMVYMSNTSWENVTGAVLRVHLPRCHRKCSSTLSPMPTRTTTTTSHTNTMNSLIQSSGLEGECSNVFWALFQ